MYAAEEFVRTLFDRAAEHSSRAVDFFGEQLTLPPEARFGSVASVQRYVDDVLDLPGVRAQWPSVDRIAVRPRRGATAAHYESVGGLGVIAVPAGGDRANSGWALRELVVLHEVAHHLCADTSPAHGRGFVTIFCALATTVMGPEVGHVLRVVYAKEGVG